MAQAQKPNRKPGAEMRQVLTANDLRSGAVRYWANDDLWTGDIAHASIAVTPDQAEHLEQRGRDEEDRNVVITAYLIDLENNPSDHQPIRVREFIRSAGPSVSYGAFAA
jgi:hypothetical protein